MARDWAKSDKVNPQDERELVRVHQHIVTRLKTKSQASRALLQQTYSDVVFSGSLFIAFLLLLPITALSFFIQPSLRSTTFNLVLMGLIYAAAVGWGVLFRRRLRTFFSQVITIGLHYYDEEQNRRARKSSRRRQPQIAS